MITELAVRASVLMSGVTPSPSPSPDGALPAGVGVVPASCATAPPGGVAQVAADILGWVKWGSLTMLGLAFFAAVGMMVWGRVTYHPKGARMGFDALVVCLVAAVVYVAGYSIIQSVTKC